MDYRTKAESTAGKVLVLAVLLLAITALVIVLSSQAVAIDISPRGIDEREWRDAQGWVLMRLDSRGRVTLLTRELAKGLPVEISRLQGSYSGKTAEAALTSRVAWKHHFVYDESGRLVREIDCEEQAHVLGPAADLKVNEKAGTALAGHRHIGERR